MAFEPYATFDQFSQVYSARGVSVEEINSYWLFYGAGRVNEEFGGVFTVPFSSNNWTARDLNIHFAYLGILERTLNQEDSEELRESIMSRVTDITSGGKAMLLDDGTTIQADKLNLDDAWSDTMDYKPTFDMRDAADQRIDPDRIENDWDLDD